MILINLHWAFSVLCLAYAVGCAVVFKKGLRRFSKKRSFWYKISHLHYFLIFFVPLINVAACITLTYMATCNDEDAEVLIEKSEEE